MEEEALQALLTSLESMKSEFVEQVQENNDSMRNEVHKAERDLRNQMHALEEEVRAIDKIVTGVDLDLRSQLSQDNDRVSRIEKQFLAVKNEKHRSDDIQRVLEEIFDTQSALSKLCADMNALKTDLRSLRESQLEFQESTCREPLPKISTSLDADAMVTQISGRVLQHLAKTSHFHKRLDELVDQVADLDSTMDQKFSLDKTCTVINDTVQLIYLELKEQPGLSCAGIGFTLADEMRRNDSNSFMRIFRLSILPKIHSWTRIPIAETVRRLMPDRSMHLTGSPSVPENFTLWRPVGYMRNALQPYKSAAKKIFMYTFPVLALLGFTLSCLNVIRVFDQSFYKQDYTRGIAIF
ncbi:hypothetical protein SISSUDRAFT_1066896 [Sistotremastrum suecicum HHB10207 ss-3]|uniref:Uncharacterized protein n=1 Tax=Sistotremastrum suecicum HHB10207 ss-3 TaxID=1314776 RepID=A0A165XRI2_9AGAM|nr:hypothetical protein SISSUDRAFT_1066896 [Sistotremastrum suecicum HHB10207 ss-3]